MLVGSIFGLHASPAQGVTNTDYATRIGDGAELWDENGFNDDVIVDLYDKLFGGQNAVDFIKTNGTYDYETYGKNSPNVEMRDIPYYVVPASTLNANVENDYGLVLTLGGLEWMVASLTLADIDGKKDQVIATLYYANVSSRWYATHSPTQLTNVQGANMYSSDNLQQNSFRTYKSRFILFGGFCRKISRSA